MTKTITPEQLVKDNYYIDIDRGLCKYVGEKFYQNKLYYTFEYASNKKMFLEENKLTLIRNYDNVGNDVKKLNKLGDTSSWVKTKAKEMKKIDAQSDELLQLYLERGKAVGFKYNKDTDEQIRFEADFPYEATIDQLNSVQDIKTDFQNGVIMNRICVGSCGFGKSEVYSRAAFKIVDNKKQVAVLLPSSILASQAYLDLIERFRNFPNIKIILFSRDNTAKQRRENILMTGNGEASIIVGTTSILSDKVIFKDLGLLVCDESHLLGQMDKTKLQKYQKDLNTLYLSGTPQPAENLRVKSGVSNLSELNTPPSNKKTIETEVAVDNDELIKMYINRELSRSGQVYCLLNNCSEMENVKLRLENLVPNITIGIVTGQMDQLEAKKVMAEFKEGKIQLLLATSIISCGISINNANTIIILESENLGLAALHQIRCRVGRSDIQPYCLLTHPKGKTLEAKAIERLKIMNDNSELNSGFEISRRDAEMRGNGQIFGKCQSGFLSNIGMDYFNELLEKSIKDKKQIIDNEKLDKAI